MDREIKTWLFDIMNAIEEIEQFLPQGKDYLKSTKMILKQSGLSKGILK